jgi:hypothetical protein
LGRRSGGLVGGRGLGSLCRAPPLRPLVSDLADVGLGVAGVDRGHRGALAGEAPQVADPAELLAKLNEVGVGRAGGGVGLGDRGVELERVGLQRVQQGLTGVDLGAEVGDDGEGGALGLHRREDVAEAGEVAGEAAALGGQLLAQRPGELGEGGVGPEVGEVEQAADAEEPRAGRGGVLCRHHLRVLEVAGTAEALGLRGHQGGARSLEILFQGVGVDPHGSQHLAERGKVLQHGAVVVSLVEQHRCGHLKHIAGHDAS